MRIDEESAGFHLGEYKGYEILVFAWLPPSQFNFKATYNIRAVGGGGSKLHYQGVIAGAFGCAEAAEEAAVVSAKKWIDEQ